MSSSSTLEQDEDCMLQLQRGDEEALNELMIRWQQPLVNFSFRFIGNEQEAIDVAQQTFVKIYEHRSSYRPGGKFSTWLFSIAANLCRNHLRWRSRHPTVSVDQEREESGDSMLDHLPSGVKSPSDQTLAREKAQAVKDAIQELPEDLKTAVLLFEYEDLSYQEIAKVLKCTPKAVETRLYRAREILRKSLEKFLGKK